ncbi:polynucleotidyl transferase, ribonuclease H-like superfamily protein [Actinidia rufa]|uniref:Polynucleotidyl transferase, ribonuclease H-like superfamily protein n=1 Tax=Actinidia rufa TaxID=165716 RepID=A0A7J0DNQ4_9ERIC|nr:polynucleotidyl transferase, ribonuclease H-like superfamily protein [Actinidia rufa]
MGLCNYFSSPTDGVLPVLVMNTIFSMALLKNNMVRLADQVGAENPHIVAAFAANRGRGAPRPRGTGRGGAPSGRGTFFNPRGGVSRGSFSNQRSNTPVGESSSSSMAPRVAHYNGILPNTSDTQE